MGAVGGAVAVPFGQVGLIRQISVELGAVRCLTLGAVVGYAYGSQGEPG